LSGRLLALNLLRFASSDAAVSVRMLDRADERYMGPAYSYEARATKRRDYRSRRRVV